MPHTYGIMQGRLSPPEDGRFQSFPRNSWREEFARARAAGVDYIEWIHDEYGRSANPIFSEAGLAEFDALKRDSTSAITSATRSAGDMRNACTGGAFDFPSNRPEPVWHSEY